jgi:hypothetical protein
MLEIRRAVARTVFGVSVGVLALAATGAAEGPPDLIFADGFEGSPSASIAFPSDGESRPAGVPIVFVGSATDPQDGPITGANLTWTSDLDGLIGTGTSFSATLSVGEHVVTLTATDSAGNTGVAWIFLTVVP